MMHVIALSGGKDSTAMALRLAETEQHEYCYVCTPTGDELPEMFEHWKNLGKLLGKPLIPVIGGTLNGLVERWNALPNWRQRWCTRALKIEPFAAWMMQQPRPLTSCIGLRADEEERSGGDYAKVPGVIVRYPLREWGWAERDVHKYLAQRGVNVPARTDCARCFYQTLGEWWNLWKDYPEVYQEAVGQELQTGHTWRSPGRDAWPTELTDLRAAFEAGRVPRDAAIQGDLFSETKCRVCRL